VVVGLGGGGLVGGRVERERERERVEGARERSKQLCILHAAAEHY
jgi:hypothetical protein